MPEGYYRWVPPVGAERRRFAEKLAVRFRDGDSVRVLAAGVGCSSKVVYTLLKEVGVSFSGPQRTRVEIRRELAADLAARFRRGESVRDLATGTGRSVPALYVLLREAGVTFTGPNGTPVRADAAAADQRRALAARLAVRYQAGETIRAIAADTGHSYGHVHRLLRDMGVLRQHGGARRRSLIDGQRKD